MDLQREVEKRKTWFYECQLRYLNIDSFRDLHEVFPDARLALVSETYISDGQPGQPSAGRCSVAWLHGK